MNRLERFNDLEESIQTALAGLQKGIWTALPGIVESFDPAACTAVIQPAIQGVKTLPDGSTVAVTMPLLLDVVVVFPRGGQYALTFPISAGDEVLVILAARAVDNWWLLGGVRSAAEARMHNLSDGFAIPGPFSKPAVFAGISPDTVQLRNESGDTFIEIDGTDVNVEAAGDINVNCEGDVTLTCAGNLSATVQGNAALTAAAATITAAAIKLQNAGSALKKLVNDAFITLFNAHVHSNVTAGAANSGTPTVAAGASQTTSTTEAE
jgi:hypothetical protein